MPGKRSNRKGFARASRQRCAAEALEPRRMLASIVFDGTSGSDTITLGTHTTVTGVFPHFMVQDFVDFTLNSQPTLSQEVHNGDHVSVNTLGGDNLVNIPTTLAGVQTSVNCVGSTIIAVGDSNGVQDIQGPISAFGDNYGLELKDQSDTSPRTTTVNGGTITGLAPAQITAAPDTGSLVGVYIYTDSAGGNITNVQNAAASVVVNDGPSDAVRVSGGGYVLAMGGAVTVDHSTDTAPANLTIGFFDPASFGVFSTSPTWEVVGKYVNSWTIDGGSGGNTFDVQRTAPDQNTPAPLTLNAGSSNDTVNVERVDTGTTLNILGGGGADNVHVGSNGSVQNIAGGLTVSNSLGATNLTIDDSGDATARTPTISGTLTPQYAQITGLAPSAIVWQVDNVATTINGGSGGNTFSITGDPIAISFITPPPIHLNTGSGNDTVAMNYATGLIFANIVLDGQAGTNSLFVVGSGPTDPFGVTPTTVTHLGQTTFYSNFNVMVLDPGMFSVSGDLGGMSLTATDPGTTVQLLGNCHLSTLTIDDGTRVTMADGGPAAGPGTLFCGIIVVRGSGKLDLEHSSLQLTYAGTPDPVATIRTYLATGAITSSFADGTHALGLGDGADGVVPNLRSGTLLLRLTRLGDLNLDNTVTFADLLALAQHYGQGNANWDQGDLNHDFTVTFADLLALAQNYGRSAAAAAPLVTLAQSAPALSLDRLKKRKRS